MNLIQHIRLHKNAVRLLKELQKRPTSPPKFFQWCADRFVNIHGESEHADYVITLEEHGVMIARFMNLSKDRII